MIRIAVADDHPVFRDGLCRLLALEPDFEIVAQIQDGRKVFQMLDEVQPDILLLDLKMPDLAGLTILQKLHGSQNRAKVIVLTASQDKNDFVQAVKFGAKGIVLKQTATDLLMQCIRRVHADEIWLDSNTSTVVMRQFSAMNAASAVPTRERSPLSEREREIVSLVAQGFKNKEMAARMFISEKTVKEALRHIFRKFGTGGPDDPDGSPGGPAAAMPAPRPTKKPTRAVGSKMPA